MVEFRQLNAPLHRASTVLFPDTETFINRQGLLFDGFSYGLYGTPTIRTLEDQVAEIEGGVRSIAVPSGLAAVTHPLLALCVTGDHVLIADCAYGPTRSFAKETLRKLGVEVEFFPSDAASIKERLRPGTRAVVLESPGYYTMEMQEIGAIAAEAHAVGALVLIDNSWGFGASSMFAHGVDICCTALSKYASGAGDLCMGSITVADEALFRTLKTFLANLGTGVSSDEAYLVMRGLSSMQVRVREHADRALELARWLSVHPAVSRVLSPPLDTDRYHERYTRFFRNGNGLLSVLLHETGIEPLRAMIDGLEHFRIGASWGSPHSLVSITEPAASREIDQWERGRYLVRLHVGLEPFELLKEDLERGFERLTLKR
ncbi:trans-sulfuration enzyme family protein [Nitratireductor pacificus]|uniref:trans-sulfuration enzyme family protein n=1 Tax=Nitratireductor pacificus TaxID=1231180 RepID=UPI002692E615